MSESAWYATWIRAAIELNMIDGHPDDGRIHPDRPVTRGEFLKMMKYAFSLPTNTPHQFADVASDAWFAPYAGSAYKNQLFGPVSGRSLLHPTAQLTKQEAVYAINTLLDTLPNYHPYKRVDSTNFRPTQKTPVTDATVQRTSLTRSILERAMARFLVRTFPSENTKLKLIQALNAERAKLDIDPLTYNAYLESAAQMHAKDMEDRGYFSHFTPEGTSYVDRIRASGYLDKNPDACQCKQVFNVNNGTQTGPNYVISGTRECTCNPSFSLGENLAKGQKTVEQVISGWMKSPPHKHNILQSQFNEVGIGLFGDVWVLNFGRLKFN